MGAEDRENTSKNPGIGSWLNILLLVIVVVLFVHAWKVYKIGVPANILTYDQNDMDVKSLELLGKEGLDFERVESVIILSRDENGKLGPTLYNRDSPGKKAANNLSFDELLLQFGSGSGNAYAGGEGPCYLIFKPGQVFRYCP